MGYKTDFLKLSRALIASFVVAGCSNGRANDDQQTGGKVDQATGSSDAGVASSDSGVEIPAETGTLVLALDWDIDPGPGVTLGSCSEAGADSIRYSITDHIEHGNVEATADRGLTSPDGCIDSIVIPGIGAGVDVTVYLNAFGPITGRDFPVHLWATTCGPYTVNGVETLHCLLENNGEIEQ